MGSDAPALAELRRAVEETPDDSYHRCNFACALAAAGAVDEALLHLAAAVRASQSQISVGCLASAIRDVADHLARSWSLPVASSPLAPAA